MFFWRKKAIVTKMKYFILVLLVVFAGIDCSYNKLVIPEGVKPARFQKKIKVLIYADDYKGADFYSFSKDWRAECLDGLSATNWYCKESLRNQETAEWLYEDFFSQASENTLSVAFPLFYVDFVEDNRCDYKVFINKSTSNSNEVEDLFQFIGTSLFMTIPTLTILPAYNCFQEVNIRAEITRCKDGKILKPVYFETNRESILWMFHTRRKLTHIGLAKVIEEILFDMEQFEDESWIPPHSSEPE